MKKLTHFFSEIENIIYSVKDKAEADKLINGYQKLFNCVNFTDYRLTFQKTNLKVIVKHKSFANKVFLFYNGKDYFIENKVIDLHLINNLLSAYFVNKLDKK